MAKDPSGATTRRKLARDYLSVTSIFALSVLTYYSTMYNIEL
jgi:hypothetical protein